MRTCASVNPSVQVQVLSAPTPCLYTVMSFTPIMMDLHMFENIATKDKIEDYRLEEVCFERKNRPNARIVLRHFHL